MAYDHTRHSIFLYGGKGDNDHNTNELWVFDLATRNWSLLGGEGPTPSPREDHTVVLDERNHALVVFGGEDGAPSHDTYAFDLDTHRWEDITRSSAPYREDHTAIYDAKRQRMIVFGGRDLDSEQTNDTWALNLDRSSPDFGVWTLLPTGDRAPSPRSEHAAAYDSSRDALIIFGGRLSRKRKYANDIWSFDLESGRWTELLAHGNGPLPIRQAVIGLNERANELIVFGGEVVGEGKKEDHLINRFWVLNLDNLLWTDRTPYPESMHDHVGVFVPEYKGMLVYGGANYRATKQHATWLLTPPGENASPSH